MHKGVKRTYAEAESQAPAVQDLLLLSHELRRQLEESLILEGGTDSVDDVAAADDPVCCPKVIIRNDACNNEN